ncbi:MAG: TlpA family protein disulfide reductase [Flavobacteriaceae bacterium]|nr:TlpA family protein disulfide reductase [Flavobacteriaceae bacterium]NNL80044.1 TlpA family protein disulfide reductase [Flavobacteriaceae bacterium]
MKWFRVLTIVGVFSLIIPSMQAQIRISEEIQPSSLATSDDYKLYLIDFWATWCGPCVSAKKYLTVMQRQLKSDFYIVSLTQESPETVRKFLKKNPTELAIAIDYDKETFQRHKIKSLPQAVLYSSDGRKLWEGHPANLKVEDIRKFSRISTSPVSPADFIKLESYAKVSDFEKDVNLPDVDLEIRKSDQSREILSVTSKHGYTAYEGHLKSIMAFLLGASENQISMDSGLSNDFYVISVKNDARKNRQLLKHVLKQLKLRLSDNSTKGEVLYLEADGSKFWGTDQIDWGQNNPKYLIDDAQIQADNVTFDEIKYRLGYLLDMPVIAETLEDNNEHDWQLHYKYYELMKSDLMDNYGIKAEKRILSYPVYKIQKKAP